MFSVYILYSASSDKYYIGSTADVEQRIKKHNSGSSRSTKPHRPWILVHEEKFDMRTDARKRENQIKKYKGGNALKRLLNIKLLH
ncbi:MAG: GIY-YIG nuclease family protein [Patescibacteria group bacterium]